MSYRGGTSSTALAGQCHGFACDLWYNVFGYDMYQGKSFTTSKQSTFSESAIKTFIKTNTRIGDIIRTEGSWVHSYVIREITDSGIRFYEYGGDYAYSKGAHKKTLTYKILANRWGKGEYYGKTVSKYFLFKINNDIYEKANGSTLKVNNNGATNISSSSFTINATLNTKQPVQKWGYFVGTNKDEVTKINGTNGSNHIDTNTMDYQTRYNWNDSPRLSDSANMNITGFTKNGVKENVKDNTTYYFKIVVKVHGTWYQSNVKSVKTIDNSVSISFDGNGGTPSATSVKFSEGSIYGDSMPSAVRDGYTFDGWYTSVTGGTRIIRSTKVTSSNKTLYAHWIKNETDFLKVGRVYRIYNENSGMVLINEGTSDGGKVVQKKSRDIGQQRALACN